jgi:drug/metabolite transporter (DMT)-like permease
MIGIIVYNLRRETSQHLLGSALLLDILAFLAGGFSEMYVAMQTAAFFTAIVAIYFLRREGRKRAQAPLLIAGFAGSIVSMAVVFFAPGNEIRQALTPESPGLLKIIGLSMLYGLKFIGKSVLLSPTPTALSLVIPALVTFALHPGERRSRDRMLRENKIGSYLLLLFSPIVGYFLIVCSMAPSVYGVSAFPEDRALTIPQFVLTTTIIFWGALSGATLKRYGLEIEKLRRWIVVVVCSVVVVLLVLGPLLSAREDFVRVPTLRAYAERWDNRDHEIRGAIEGGAKHLVVSALGFTGGLADIKNDPDYWVNRCFASYYGLESVTAK